MISQPHRRNVNVNHRHGSLIGTVLFSCLIALSLFLSPLRLNPAIADGETTLSVTPAAGYVLLDDSITMSLYAANTVDLNAFDVTVTYDPTLVTLTSWSHGGLLSNLSNVKITNTAGSLRVVATQLSTPGVTGSGILLNLVFKGIAYGTSPITITKAAFSNTIPTSIYPILQNGVLQVYGDPTAVDLVSFTAVGDLKSINLNWETASEYDNLGFNLYRANSLDGEKTRLNAELIPSGVYPGALFGASYTFVDTTVKKNRVYYYWLEDLDLYGHSHLSGPVTAQTQKPNSQGK